MMGWQWHQLDDMQIICTLLKTDNHASTSPLSFYRPDARSCHPNNNRIKTLKANFQTFVFISAFGQIVGTTVRIR